MKSTIWDFSIARLDTLRRAIVSRLGGFTVGVRALVVDEDNNVLLVRHTYGDGWHTPGGGVTAHESPVAALKRELREEVGLEAIGSPELLHVFVHNFRGITDFPIFYLVTSFAGEATVMDPLEIADLKWVPLEEAVAVAAPKTGAFIAEFVNGRDFRERW